LSMTAKAPSARASRARSGVPWSAEYRMHTPDGRTIWVHDETTFLHDADGTPIYLQGVIFDVTERKLAEQALRESEQREREAAERLRALDEMKNTFLAAVSHELRSPLTSILGLSLTLERGPNMVESDRSDLLRRLATNAKKLDRLLRDLLDIDRLNRGIVEPQYRVTDVGALARRTVESLDILSGRDVVAEAEPVVIAVDPAKVERIIENLLMNAARHTTADRRIWLKVAGMDDGVLLIRHAKFDRMRLVPLHPSVTAVLRDYAATRDRLCPTPRVDRFFVSIRGRALRGSEVDRIFAMMTVRLGLRAAAVRPRVHDLRHSFAVRTLIDWQREGADIPALVPVLSTYLGHVEPANTYWYLSAVPELMQLAAARLEHQHGDRS